MIPNEHSKEHQSATTSYSKCTQLRTPYSPYVTDFDIIYNQSYQGEGTLTNPYVVDWLPDDPENPQTWNTIYKCFLTAFVSITAMGVTFCSSIFISEYNTLTKEFQPSREVLTLGISLFVIGFALGPLLWASLSEMFGRRIIFIITYVALTVFNASTASSRNIWTILILRFFAGAFGSSPLANAGGTIADLFSVHHRGTALTFYAAMPFLGPILGPIVGGYASSAIDWRWIQGLMAIFTGILAMIGILFLSETYAPFLLRLRAEKLSRMTGFVYRSKFEVKNQVIFRRLLKISLSRPWIFLVREPIVSLLSLYMALIYGILYMFVSAFPIVYGEERGWTSGSVGLSFLGMAIGVIIAVLYCILDNRRYIKLTQANVSHRVPPETRLPPAIVGAIALPISLFWFAWTNYPSMHFIISTSACVPFGFGIVLVFVAIINYLVDSYMIYAASALAANSILRSLFGAAFPLFTTKMFHNIGIHWAVSVPAFAALLCIPLPYLFWKYGSFARQRSKYASEIIMLMEAAHKSSDNDLEGNTEVKSSIRYSIVSDNVTIVRL
ncbi:unnamed protein product [Adineta ricciae]|uniref:Major facilitator superfamily (MFS) profile domain-containing protein n=1 Tax=Adineta ricciae TaxID=249248 RepID=A0A814Z8G6_ADIRI|nr:unnamed protein product [Adineta ricciae]